MSYGGTHLQSQNPGGRGGQVSEFGPRLYSETLKVLGGRQTEVVSQRRILTSQHAPEFVC